MQKSWRNKMTNEQKQQTLGYYGYTLFVSSNPVRQASYVQTPDNIWLAYIDFGDIYASDFDAIQLAKLIDIAWAHFEQQERVARLECIVYNAGYRNVMGDREDEKLYNSLIDKFEVNNG